MGSPWPNRFGAIRAIQMGQTWEDQFEMVSNFGDGTDSAPGRADGVALAEGDGGGDSVDSVNAGSIHSLEELAGIRAESFRVTPLPFGVEGIEGEGRLP